MYFMFVFWAGYLIFFGTTFAFAFDGGATEAYHVMNWIDICPCAGFPDTPAFPKNTHPGSEALPLSLIHIYALLNNKIAQNNTLYKYSMPSCKFMNKLSLIHI